MFLFGFITGVIVGAIFGVFLVAVCTVSGRSEEESEKEFEAFKAEREGKR